MQTAERQRQYVVSKGTANAAGRRVAASPRVVRGTHALLRQRGTTESRASLASPPSRHAAHASHMSSPAAKNFFFAAYAHITLRLSSTPDILRLFILPDRLTDAPLG